MTTESHAIPQRARECRGMSAFPPEVEVAVAGTREEVANLHAELVRNGLVVWTGGNVSGRVLGADAFVIKPSGVSCDDPSPENMIVCNLDGVAVANTPGNEREPPSDTAAHAYVYRNMPAVGGVVHTPSPYATAWAARGEAIPRDAIDALLHRYQNDYGQDAQRSMA